MASDRDISYMEFAIVIKEMYNLIRFFPFKIIHSINCVIDYSDQEVKLKKIASVIYSLVLYL